MSDNVSREFVRQNCCTEQTIPFTVARFCHLTFDKQLFCLFSPSFALFSFCYALSRLVGFCNFICCFLHYRTMVIYIIAPSSSLSVDGSRKKSFLQHVIVDVSHHSICDRNKATKIQ